MAPVEEPDARTLSMPTRTSILSPTPKPEVVLGGGVGAGTGAGAGMGAGVGAGAGTGGVIPSTVIVFLHVPVIQETLCFVICHSNVYEPAVAGAVAETANRTDCPGTIGESGNMTRFTPHDLLGLLAPSKIGRASCRER